jgi:transposase, IS5 family
MGQLGFFDADGRLAALSAKGDPLEAIDRLVPWESFRADIEAVVLTPDEMRKSSAGRKPVDAIVDVPNAGFAGTQQSFRRAGGISGG